MSDLALKVGEGAGYHDGDILCAFNSRRIRAVHAQHLCHLRDIGFTREGLRPSECLARDLREAVCQFRFERISRSEVLRLEIATGAVHRFGAVPVIVLSDPRKQGQYIEVDEFVARRLRHAGHAIFGIPGREFWYGGIETYTHAVLDLIWAEIERKTTRREAEHVHQSWPAGRLDLRHHLMIRVEEFEDVTADRLVAEVKDGRNILMKREYSIDLERLGLSRWQLQQVRNRQIAYDDRPRMCHAMSCIRSRQLIAAA